MGRGITLPCPLQAARTTSGQLGVSSRHGWRGGAGGAALRAGTDSGAACRRAVFLKLQTDKTNDCVERCS